MFRLCRDPFNSSLYSSVRAHLYLFAEGTINARQLLALCEVRTTLVSYGVVVVLTNDHGLPELLRLILALNP